MVNLEITLLGSPKILRENKPFDTDRRKAIALLAYLIVTGKPQPREHLAALLWPDYDRESAFAYLRRTLYEINKGLGARWLVSDRQIIKFDHSAGARVDVLFFTEKLTAARQAQDPLPHLEAAALVYQGEFLAGFYVQDTAPFEEWVLVQRESYLREYTAVLEQLTSIYVQRSAWETALERAVAWLGWDNLNEAAHRALMRIYASMGDRTRAIRQYELCRDILLAELGVEPMSETTTLLNRIREGSFSTVSPPAEPTSTGESKSNLHLPILATPFIGRRPEIDQVKMLILQPQNRLVTLFGPGGMGKTRLGIQAASELGDYFPDGVWFVPLAAVFSVEGVVTALAKALDFYFYQEDDPQGKQLLEYLRYKQMLILLDNLEQLVRPETTHLLLEILGVAENIKLLVTSRIRLNIQAEQVFSLEGMNKPTPAEVVLWRDPEAQADSFSALSLFRDRARRVQPEFAYSATNIKPAVEICQLVQGMPLALELAASWLELLPPDEIAAEIQRSYDFLETDQVDVPDRQRSLRAVFDTSWKLLTERERDIFLTLSVFAGSFTRAAAQSVSGSDLRTLLSLANKSWLQQVMGGRFQLQPLLQHYGFERLRQEPQAWQIAAERHAAYYAEFVAQQAVRLRGSEQLAALSELALEFDSNIKAAWDWLVEAGEWQILREKMILGVFQFVNTRWRGDELVVWLRYAREKLEKETSREGLLTGLILGTIEVFFEEIWGIKEYHPEDRLNSLWRTANQENLVEEMGLWFILLGKLYTTRNQNPRAEEQLEAAVAAMRKQNDPWLLGVTLMLQSALWGQMPSEKWTSTIEPILSEAMQIFKQLGSVYEQADISRTMAELALVKHLSLTETVELYQRAQEFYVQLNDRAGVGSIYQTLGNLYFSRGFPKEGFSAYQKMRAIFAELGDQRMVGESLAWESLWASRYSTLEHALETRQRAVLHSKLFRTPTIVTWNVLELGEIYRIFGDNQKARIHYEEAHAYINQINLVLAQGYYQRAMGDLAMAEHRFADAHQCYQAYWESAEADNHQWSMAQAAIKLAWVYAHLGEPGRSRRNIATCLGLLGESEDVGLLQMVLLTEARCLAAEGKAQKAVSLAAYVVEHPLVFNEIRDLGQSLLSEMAKKLDESAYESAYSQILGREFRDLEAELLANYASGEVNKAADL